MKTHLQTVRKVEQSADAHERAWRRRYELERDDDDRTGSGGLVQPASRLSLGAMLALLAIGALSGVVTGWLLSVFFRG